MCIRTQPDIGVFCYKQILFIYINSSNKKNLLYFIFCQHFFNMLNSKGSSLQYPLYFLFVVKYTKRYKEIYQHKFL